MRREYENRRSNVKRQTAAAYSRYTHVMNWLLRRVLALWLILAVTFAAVLLIARLNRTPDRLQALGFDVCDGEPCFRGIKLGTDWSKVQGIAPTILADVFMKDLWHQRAKISVNSARVDDIYVFGYGGKVTNINIAPSPEDPYDFTVPFTVGDVIARYGWPCRVSGIGGVNEPGTWFLYYSKLQVTVDFWSNNPSSINFRLQINSSVRSLTITDDNSPFGTCNNFSQPWRGFILLKVYHLRNHRDFGGPQP